MQYSPNGWQRFKCLWGVQFILMFLWTANFPNFCNLYTSKRLISNISWVPTGEGNGTPLQYSCLENPMDGGARRAVVNGVVKSRTGLSDFTFTFHFPALEKEMATHSSVLAWRIPGTGEPGGLLSLGSHRVGHDWNDLAAAVAVLPVLQALRTWAYLLL